jgi:hypothetical protein
MDRIDFQQLKSGEVNLGVGLHFIRTQGRNSGLAADLNYGCPIRQGRRHWRGQSYNHRQLYRKMLQLQRRNTECETPLQANRVTDKLTHVHDRVYCCRSGSAADTQAVADIVTYYLQMYTYVSPFYSIKLCIFK